MDSGGNKKVGDLATAPTAPTTPTDAMLREEVRLLGGLLGEVLQGREGKDLFELVEKVRGLAKGARKGDGQRAAELRTLLAGLPDKMALPMARAFSHFLQLANVAEQRYRARSDQNSPELDFASCWRRWTEGGVSPERVTEALLSLRVELVLTAHPTQVVRRTLLSKYRRVTELLEMRERAAGQPGEQERLVRLLRREIAAIWHTDEVRRRRVTPMDEARGGLVLFEQVLWNAVPAHLRTLDRALIAVGGKGLPLNVAPIRFGSWMGGDRDGNPNVTPAVTAEVCLMARWMAADLYAREVANLHDELSVEPCNDELRNRVGDSREPYRTLLKVVEARLKDTRTTCEQELGRLRKTGRLASEKPIEFAYRDAQNLWDDLLLCHRSLNEVGLGLLAEGPLEDILRRISAFGLTLGRLDLRQEASVHTGALSELTQLLGLGKYGDWQEDKRQTFLLERLTAPALPLKVDALPAGPLKEMLELFSVAAAQGRDALGRYIISMAGHPSDVLAVYFLQHLAGFSEPLAVEPLFETLDDLEHAPAIVEGLLGLPWYRDKVGGELELMLGYSDSTKDVGRLGSAWALYRAQDKLAEVGRKKNVRISFFHGRGGTIARGGGPIYLAILSQPPGSVNGRMRVTVQGETIESTLGLLDVATQSLARYTHAALEATLCPPKAPTAAWVALMDQMGATSAKAYRAVVRDNPNFRSYFAAATPEPELALLNVGSRPARRGARAELSALRAIPWVFAWTQVRLHLPSWLGIGEALEEAMSGKDEAKGSDHTLLEMAQEWTFFRSFLDLVEMVLAKAEPDIAAYYERLLVPEEKRALGQTLREQCAATAACVRRVTGHKELLEENPFLLQSVRLRNPYVDPLNLLQAEVLRRVRQKGEQNGNDGRLMSTLLVTVNGVAAGMRNTG